MAANTTTVALPCGIDNCKRCGVVIHEEGLQVFNRHDGDKHSPIFTWEVLRANWLKLKGHGDRGVSLARLPGAAQENK